MRDTFWTLLLGSLALIMVAVCAGCSPEEDLRLGSDGELCFRDADCRDGLICSAGLCAEFGRTDGCTTFCSHLAECGEEASGCEQGCSSTTRKWTDAAYDEFMACVPTVSCGEVATGGLDGCLPAADPARLETCNDLVYSIEQACGRGAEFGDACTVAAATLPTDIFDAVGGCDTSECGTFFACQQAAW